jgi:hypothetical protein
VPRCLIRLWIPSPGATWEGFMAHGPQVSPAIEYIADIFEATSTIATRSNVAPAVSRPMVLLVGRSGSWGTPVLKSLEKLKSRISHATPAEVTAEYVKRDGYHLILLDSTVPPEQRKQLSAELIGSGASIFYTFPVENGCWWLPALRHGEDCHGAPAFRRSEIPFELLRIFHDQTES